MVILMYAQLSSVIVLRPYYRAASLLKAKAEYDRYDEKFKQYSDSAYNEN